MGSRNTETRKKVIVLGAGVVGLTTALKIQEAGGNYDVTLISEVLPSDPKNIKYTSHWAGAHHVLNPTTDEKLHEMEMDTYNTMWELSKPGSLTEQYFLRITQEEYFHDPKLLPRLDRLHDYKVLPKESVPKGAVLGVSFSTVTIDTPRYLAYLASRFAAGGGRALKGSAQHINQIVEGGEHIFSATGMLVSPPDAVVVCTGLGARFLGGIEDQAVYPIRGQTVMIRAPWVRFGRTINLKDTELTYIIPRRSGDVILGGTKIPNDWYPVVRPEITRDILERSFTLCPELAPPEIREQREPTLEDVLPLVIEEGCGFRPARKGGIRLEVEWVEARQGAKKVPVVFNYGHGGYGYQTSWASADIALKLLGDALKTGGANK